MKKLTIGMLTHDDFNGVYFSIQSIRLHHPEILGEIEFLILDNSPDSKHGLAVKRLTNWMKDAPVRYIAVTDERGTALRDRVFQLARTPFVLCIDCHVLMAPGSLRRLIDFFTSGADDGNLLHGPMLYDNMDVGATHMEPVWRDGMWGIWGIDKRGLHTDGEPFEIPAHGLGIFSCRLKTWPGFNPLFRGFGGEECYIHEKMRRSGKTSMCLPFLRWLHRFDRPDGVPYSAKWEDRIFNYFVGHIELSLDPQPVIDHFSTIVPSAKVLEIQKISQEAMSF